MESVALVYRECALQWWAELWETCPEGLAWNDNILLKSDNPPRPNGMWRIGLTLHATKRGAKKSAALMKARYLAGYPVSIEEEVIETEFV